MMKNDEREAIVAKANLLASNDFKINGTYANAPYTVIHNDNRYRAKLSMRSVKGVDGNTNELYLTIVQPETYIGNSLLQTNS